MEKVKRVPVSDCCESSVHFIPPSLGEHGMYFCSACNTVCKTKFIERELYTEIKKGVYRKK
jgi:hypothetical protein